jgi:hypothetical protein
MTPTLPHLAFIPVDRLLVHERHDDERTLPLIRRIKASGVFRNPPVVAPLEDGSERYMVLDGANRTTALREMGYPHALVQVVEPNDPGLRLENWNHVVWELSHARFLSSLEQIDELELVPIEQEAREPDLIGDCGLAQVRLKDQQAYTICTPAKALVRRVDLLNSIVDVYRTHSRLDRTMARDVRPLVDIYPNLCGLVIFPRFNIHDLLLLAGEGYLLPTGITRFTISPRALHLNYPLEELAADRPVDEKNQALYRWIQDQLNRKRVRYYAEATFLFDE